MEVKFLKNGMAYGYGYFAGHKGKIKKSDVEKLQKLKIIEVLKVDKKSVGADKQ